VQTASIYDLEPAELGRFDAVLVLGLIYHLENPIGALRIAASLARPGAPVIVDSQLTRQTDPVEHSDGVGENIHREAASWAARLEPLHEQEGTPLSAFGGVISLIPNRAALLQAMQIAGLGRIEVLRATLHQHREYSLRDRVLVVGWR
jgi:tRNA (mo5U34)-methyltransferase